MPDAGSDLTVRYRDGKCYINWPDAYASSLAKNSVVR